MKLKAGLAELFLTHGGEEETLPKRDAWRLMADSGHNAPLGLMYNHASFDCRLWQLAVLLPVANQKLASWLNWTCMQSLSFNISM